MNHLVRRSVQAVAGLLAGTAALTAILVGTDTAAAAPSSPPRDGVTAVRTIDDGAGAGGVGGPTEPGTAEAVGSPAGDVVEPVTVTPVGPVDDPGPTRPGTAVPVGKPDTSTTTGGRQVTLPADR